MQDHNQNKLRISVFIGIFMILGLMACYGLDPNDPADASGDLDNDGYTNLQEYQHGWNPADPNSPPKDTDKDGMPDTWETQYGLDPNNPSDASGDLDNDGYTNLQEYQHGWNPADPNSPPPPPADTDGDGMPDTWETQYGLNPNDPSDASGDLDNDGKTNLQEYQHGWNPADPNSPPIPQDWSAPQTVDGRTARVTTSSGAMLVVSLSEDDGAQIRFKEVKIGIHYKIDGEGVFPVLQYCGEEYFTGPGYGTNQPATGWTEAGFLNGTSGSWRTDVITLGSDKYDYWPTNPGIQILMNFPYPITVARMWIIQEGENAVFFDVGGTEDAGYTSRIPGFTGFSQRWNNPSLIDGYTARISRTTNFASAGFLVNLPDGEQAFDYQKVKVGIMYKASDEGIAIIQFLSNSGWVEIGQLIGDGQWHTQVVDLDSRFYDYTQDPGQNINVAFRPAVFGGQVTLAGLWLINETPKADAYFDVGGPADTGSTAYELFSRSDRNPGFAIAVPPIFMEQWEAPAVVDGYTARVSLPSTEYMGAGGFLVNLPGGEQAFDYRKIKIGIMYKTSAEGTIAQFLGATNGGNVAIGRLIADGQWHTQVVELDSRFWDYKKQSWAPGININVGFLPDVIGGQVTLAGLWLINETPPADYFDVGGPEDTGYTSSLPGFRFTQRWDNPSLIDGYTARSSRTLTNFASAGFYLTMPDGEQAFDYQKVKVGMLYKASGEDIPIIQYLSQSQYVTLGQLITDDQWHTQVVELDESRYDYLLDEAGLNLVVAFRPAVFGGGQVTLAGLWLIQEETIMANLKVSGTDIDGNLRVARSPVFFLKTDQPYFFTCKASARWVEGLTLNGKLYTCEGLDENGSLTHVTDITLPIRNMCQYDFAVDRFGIASYQNEDMSADTGRMTIGIDCIKLGPAVDASLWQ